MNQTNPANQVNQPNKSNKSNEAYKSIKSQSRPNQGIHNFHVFPIWNSAYQSIIHECASMEGYAFLFQYIQANAGSISSIFKKIQEDLKRFKAISAEYFRYKQLRCVWQVQTIDAKLINEANEAIEANLSNQQHM